jgi:hypothetical protein
MDLKIVMEICLELQLDLALNWMGKAWCLVKLLMIIQ